MDGHRFPNLSDKAFSECSLYFKPEHLRVTLPVPVVLVQVVGKRICPVFLLNEIAML